MSGTSTIPTIASTNAEPLNSTARLAVAPTVAIASSFSRPWRRSSRIAGDDEERVVDPEREAHPRDHVHHEDREVERLADERREPERDDDRDERDEHRHQPRDDRAEDEEQHDQRRRQPELELSLLEVLLREHREVPVRRELAGDRRLEPVACGRVDGLDHPLDARVTVAREADRDHRRAPARAIRGSRPEWSSRCGRAA